MPTDESNPRKILGRNIKDCRRRLGLTQAQLAERCALYRSYLSRIEAGIANPSLTVMVRIAAELQADIRALLMA